MTAIYADCPWCAGDETADGCTCPTIVLLGGMPGQGKSNARRWLAEEAPEITSGDAAPCRE